LQPAIAIATNPSVIQQNARFIFVLLFTWCFAISAALVAARQLYVALPDVQIATLQNFFLMRFFGNMHPGKG
jgi:uncharacterized membrane protein